MDSEQLAKLWESFSINDEDIQAVNLDDSLISFGENMIAKTVVVKIVSNKPVIREAFRQSMKSLWRLSDTSTIECLGVNLFAVTGIGSEKKMRIANGGLWHFNNFLLVTEEPSGLGVISNFKLNKMMGKIYREEYLGSSRGKRIQMIGMSLPSEGTLTRKPYVRIQPMPKETKTETDKETKTNSAQKN